MKRQITKVIKSQKTASWLLIAISVLALLLLYTGMSPFNDVFWWLMNACLFTLALSLAVCTLARLKIYMRCRAMKPLGSIIFHLGMVVVLLGFLANVLWGFKGDVFIPQGVMVKVPENMRVVKKGPLARSMPAYSVALDKLTYGRPNEHDKYRIRYAADVVFIDGAGQSRQQVRINYQAFFRGMYWKYGNSGYSVFLNIKEGDKVIVNDYANIATHGETAWYDTVPVTADLILEIRYYPDFTKAKNGKYLSNTIFPNNPVMDLTIIEKGRRLGPVLIPMAQSRSVGRFRVSFPRFRYWQIFDVGADPGRMLILAGCFATVAGLVWRVLLGEDTLPRMISKRL